MRDWWPFWWQIPLTREGVKPPIFIFGWGLDLINKEIQNTTEVIWKKK